MLLQITEAIGEWLATAGPLIGIVFVMIITGIALPAIGTIASVIVLIVYIDIIFYGYPITLDTASAIAAVVGIVIYFTIHLLMYLYEKKELGYSDFGLYWGVYAGMIPHSITAVLIMFYLTGVAGAIITGLILGLFDVLLIFESRHTEICFKFRGEMRCIGGRPT